MQCPVPRKPAPSHPPSRSVHCRGAIVIHAGTSHCVRVRVRIQRIDILRPNVHRNTARDQRRRRHVQHLAPLGPAPRIEHRTRARCPAARLAECYPVRGRVHGCLGVDAQHKAEVEGRKSQDRSSRMRVWTGLIHSPGLLSRRSTRGEFVGTGLTVPLRVDTHPRWARHGPRYRARSLLRGIQMCEITLETLEQILTTPLPFLYSVHIWSMRTPSETGGFSPPLHIVRFLSFANCSQ
ncbi:hypothetical protein C8R44DRAFT_356419 [Mycena epipterygia]|nr:hypothetical protein C8R44DRAFT_356419 [Mycena epipterygia]